MDTQLLERRVSMLALGETLITLTQTLQQYW